MPSRVARSRGGISSTVVIGVVVIVIIVAVAGVIYYASIGTTTTTSVPPQTFTFGFLHTDDPSHALAVDALNHLSRFNLKPHVIGIADPTSLTSATSQGQVDMFAFQFPTTTINAIEKGANVIGVAADSTAFLQDLVVSSNITTFQQLNGTTMAAFDLDGPVLFPL